VYSCKLKKIINVQTQYLKPGDIVKVKKDCEIPSDLLFFSSSLSSGACYIETINLDGETNLKEKLICKEMKKIDIKDLSNLKGDIICERPNMDLEKWSGSLYLEDSHTDEKILCK